MSKKITFPSGDPEEFWMHPDDYRDWKARKGDKMPDAVMVPLPGGRGELAYVGPNPRLPP